MKRWSYICLTIKVPKKEFWLNLKDPDEAAHNELLHLVVVVVALLFYVHGKHLRSCRDGKLT